MTFDCSHENKKTRCCFADHGTALYLPHVQQLSCFPHSINNINNLWPIVVAAVNNSEFKQQRRERQRQRKHHLKINIWEIVTISVMIIASSSDPFVFDGARCK